MLYWIGRHPERAMTIAGLSLLVATGCWEVLMNWISAEAPRLWKYWAIFDISFGLCAAGGPLLLVCGFVTSLVRRGRQAGKPPN